MGITENKCDVLRDILRRCIATDTDKTLCAVMECGIEGRADADKVLADFDEIFAIAPQKIMCADAKEFQNFFLLISGRRRLAAMNCVPLF